MLCRFDAIKSHLGCCDSRNEVLLVKRLVLHVGCMLEPVRFCKRLRSTFSIVEGQLHGIDDEV